MDPQLKESQTWFSTVLESIGDAVIATDATGTVKFMNPAAEQLTGWTGGQAQGQPLEKIFRIINENSGAKVENPVKRVLHEGVVVGLANHTLLIRKDGRQIPIKGSGAPIFAPGGELTGVVLVFRDDTVSRQATRALEENRRYFRSLISHLHEDILVIDRDFTVTDVNNTFLTTTGHWREAVIGRHCYEITHGYTTPCRENNKDCRLEKVFATGRPQQCNHVHRALDGSEHVVDIRFSPLKGEGGTVTHVIETIRDVTDLVQVKKELAESEQRYRTLVEHTNDGICLLKQNRHIYVNATYLQIFGYKKPEQLLGKSFEMLVHPDDRQRISELSRRRRQGMVAADRYECKAIKKNSTTIFIEISATLTTYQGDPLTLAFVREITERHRQEVKQRQLITAMEQIQEAVVVTDTTAAIIYVNPAFEKITGYQRMEVMGQNPRILKSGRQDAAFYRALWDTLTAGRNWTGRFINKKKDGSLYEEDASISPVIDKNGTLTHYVAVKRDITEEINRQRQLRQAQKMEAIGTLAGGIAHDFNNILSAVIGYSEIMLDKLAPDSPLRPNLQEVLAAGLRARDLVKQILAFSRQSEQEFQAIQVHLMVKEALKFLRASLPTTIEIRRNIKSAATVMADPTQLHQVIMNLCTNAGHAMREKGGILEISLEEQTLGPDFVARHQEIEPGAYVVLTISDTGCGMSEQIMGRIFEPFFTTKDKEEGTGLGLSVVHGIVKNHGGTVTVYSEQGRGTTFHVYLPIVHHDAEAPAEIKGPLPTGDEAILFVDDEKALGDIGVQLLAGLGYRVTNRTSSVEALELFKARPERFDLVITDLTMPNMTGLELARQIKRLRPDIPILLCTGFSEGVTPESAQATGIASFLMKPLTIHALSREVRKALDG